jgi:hypothetical protein
MLVNVDAREQGARSVAFLIPGRLRLGTLLLDRAESYMRVHFPAGGRPPASPACLAKPDGQWC